MENQNAQDAKDTSQEINREVGSSSAPDVQKIDPENNRIVSTVEDDAPPKGADDSAAKAEAAKAAEEKAKADAEKAKGQDARYDKDPAWQRIMKERDDAVAAKAKAEAEAELLKQGYKPPAQAGSEGKPEELPFKDITKMSKEEVIEWMEEDPIGYAENLRAMARWDLQQAEKAKTAEAEQQDTMARVEKTFTDYAKENETFDAMWKSGEIQKFMQDNPGHNAISAHMILTQGKSLQAKVDAAVAKAIKDTEDKMLANFKAKRSATVLDGGPAGGAPQDPDAELQDTKSAGGRDMVIANRLARMRRGQAL